jgi:hypothetical protein
LKCFETFIERIIKEFFLKTKLALAALAIFALAACTQTEQLVSTNKEAKAASVVTTITLDSIVSYDTTVVKTPSDYVVNGGNTSNDSCYQGTYFKRKPNSTEWERIAVNGQEWHAQCTERTVTITRVVTYVRDTSVVVIPNKPPVAVAAVANPVVECANYGGTVALDGSASYDEDGTIVSYAWLKGASQIASSATASVVLPLGTHTLTLVVTDNEGATDSKSVTVKVEDTQAPVVTLNVTPGTLWSPNHKYVVISSGAVVRDACASNLSDLAVSGSVVSNEVDNSKADGNTVGDVKVTRANGTILLSSNTAPVVAYNALSDKLELRSERAGNKSSRIYSMGLSATDPSGNGASASGAVVVPHNQ